MKNVKIPVDLFELMAGYIHDHYDMEDSIRYHKIEDGLRKKRNAMIRHEYYTISKTDDSAELREWARQQYLDEAGIGSDFRWDNSGK